MKKVGIITFHCADNFGAFLQVYALQKTIADLGVRVEIIDFRPDKLIMPYNNKISINKSINQVGYLRTLKKLIIKKLNYKNITQRMTSYSIIRDKYLILSKEKYYTSDRLKNDPPRYDYYISGSDQVWNPHFKEEIGDAYFLDFVVDNYLIKISYAASIAEPVADNLRDTYSKLISKFDFISVREQTAKEYLEYIIPQKKEVFVHLDPTFLLTSNEWDKLIKKTDINDKYIFVYDLQKSDELIKLANRISSEKGYKVISYSKIKNFKNGIKSFAYSNPSEFLNYLKNSEFVLTTSFHGLAFAIIFNKPFYTIPHNTRGSRMIDLLKSLNLDDRIVCKNEEIKDINYRLDFFKSNLIIKQKKEESIIYLKKAMDIKE